MQITDKTEKNIAISEISLTGRFSRNSSQISGNVHISGGMLGIRSLRGNAPKTTLQFSEKFSTIFSTILKTELLFFQGRKSQKCFSFSFFVQLFQTPQVLFHRHSKDIYMDRKEKVIA